jgi:hypothetical protein
MLPYLSAKITLEQFQEKWKPVSVRNCAKTRS